MRVLVDASIWSLALRRRARDLSSEGNLLTEELRELIRENRAQLIGPIRQELLSEIREASQYKRLKEHLRAFPDEPLGPPDFDLAARLSNQYRAAGVSGSAADFLICAVALDRRWPIFTTDADFKRYAQVLRIVAHLPRKQ